jgi:uncharacterized membrane protein
MTPAMKVQGAYLQCFLAFAIVIAGAQSVAAQALYVERLDGGTELLVVAQPLADATTVIWPSAAAIEEGPVVVTSGDLTMVADIEAALAGDETEAAPAVVVAVGGATVSDLRALLERLLSRRPLAPPPTAGADAIVEGRLERRLGAAGSDAEIRLEVNLPSPSDPMRSAIEVLWELLPEILADDLAGARSRIDGDRGLLEARTDSSTAEIAVSSLRLGLAQLGENPAVQSGPVEAAARRLQVRRQASLEEHPYSAELILDLWIRGGADAVREFLFGVDGVTMQKVRDAASSWLPQHPGNVVVSLPPRSFNPRFASPPAIFQLESGLSAAVLERSGAPLATLCMRPVVVPDLDDELAATVLARVARELRELEQRPGWVRVDTTPPQILLAAPTDQFSELSEVLRAALAQAERDERPVMASGGTARQRALRLMAGMLGVAEGSSLSPASLLRAGNLSIGVVAEDLEAASEAVRKFWTFDGRAVESASVRALAPVPKTREAAAGENSVLVVALELPMAMDEAQMLVLAELLESRGEALLAEGTVELLRPFVPGYRVLLVVATATAAIDSVEASVREGWAGFTGTVSEDELAGVRRRVAAAYAGRWGGTTGRACRCAAVASGAVVWRSTAEIEMAILTVPIEIVDTVLRGVADWDSLQNTGAGVLPIIEFDERGGK